MPNSKIRRILHIEHRYLECVAPFDDADRVLTTLVPPLEPEILESLARGDRDKVEVLRRSAPKLWLFLTRNHGQLTATDGLNSRAIQYDIGNPLTAERMTRFQLAAGLYAPLRVYLYENEQGRAIFECDLPSNLFGQFGDERVTAVGRELDAELEQTLQAAAGL
jgi:hypothetical protein